MTPEDRADQLYFELSIILPPLPHEWSAMAVQEACTTMIRDAIRAAVEAEREACAAACDTVGKIIDLNRIAVVDSLRIDNLVAMHAAAERCAIDIRARKDTA